MSESVRRRHGLPAMAWVILIVTAVMALVWSSHKLLEQDEIFSLQTDRVASLAEVVRIQREYPISLEPPPYHVLAHAAMQFFGPGAFALRLPALLGYLAMLACLFVFVRRLAGERAGLVAMAIPPLTTTLYFAAEGRPYGLLLGCYGFAMVCWQAATRVRKDGDRTDGSQAARVWPLVGLALAIGFTLTVHFYGVLLLVPICGAELVRTLTRRRLDWPVLAAILAGMAALAPTLPYVRSSGEFKKHYYAARISAHMLTQPYRQMMLDYTRFPHAIQTMLVLVLLAAALAVLWGCRQAIRSGAVDVSAGETALIGLLVLLPVFAFVMGRAVTHALEVRHSIGAILGICTMVGVALASALRRTSLFHILLGALLLGSVVFNAQRAVCNAREDRQQLGRMVLTPAQAIAVAGRNVYFQDLGQWEMASLYEPDPELRGRLVLVYSRDEELTRQRHDTMYLTAVHTQRFDSLPIVSYDALRRQPGEHVFAVFHSGWSWTDAAFAEQAASVMPLGPAFGGDLVGVRFKQQ